MTAKPEAYMHPFPNPESVFAHDVELHRKHFLPLVSIDAAVIEPSWKGLLHIVTVKETYDGAVGEHCPEYWTDLCKDNQVAFRVDADGRYTFLADFRYFIVERGGKPEAKSFVESQGFADEFSEHYERLESSFSETRAFYKETGHLNPNSRRQPDRKDTWLTMGTEPRLVNVQPQILPSGNQLRFVAQARGWSYCESGADNVALFFDPIDRIAIVSFDFT